MLKKRVLLTGGSGFIGRNIKEYLSGICDLYVPDRRELNLLDEQKVRQYLQEKQIQVVIHAANPNPVKNKLDKAELMFEDSMRAFTNLYQAEDAYEYMYTLGSGAEYDKSRDIAMIKEEEEGRSVPYDGYGLAKFIMNELIAKSSKQCNLKLFGCYGPTDHSSKFITHAIRCCLQKEDITIRQNCYFDYMHVHDLAKILGHFIYHEPKFHTYNVCTGKRCCLLEIASEVRRQMRVENEIVLLKPGLNREYTGDNQRLLSELGEYSFIDLKDGIAMQIESETKGNRGNET